MQMVSGYSVNDSKQIRHPGIVKESSCLPWEDSEKNGSKCACRTDLVSEMKCKDGILYLDVNRCLTYENSTLYESSCPYIKLQSASNDSSVVVPANLSQINGFFCDSLNREGLICNQCKKGFGISLLRVGYKCTDCSHPWHGLFLYFFFQFVPLTIFYIIIFMLQISITSIPMNCFVFFSQIVVGAFTYDELVVNAVLMDSTPFLKTVFTILLTLYEPWNLDFFTNLLPEFCISQSMKNIHISILLYIPALYFLVLTVLTFSILKLNNFRCQVGLYQRLSKPVRLCLSKVRSLWNPKASVVDVLATLFILSFNRILFDSLLIFRYSHVKDISTHPPKILYKALHMDITVKFNSSYHIYFMVPAILVLCFLSTVFMLLACYPFGFFRRMLACLVRRAELLHINAFVEKLQGHYKDGTNGTYDLRLFSVHYLFLRVLLIVIVFVGPGTLKYLTRAAVLIASSIIVLIARPYKVSYLSAYDGLLLALLGTLAVLVNLKVFFFRTSGHTIVALIAIFLALPQLALLIYIATKAMKLLVGKCKRKNALEDVAIGTDFETDRLQDPFHNHHIQAHMDRIGTGASLGIAKDQCPGSAQTEKNNHHSSDKGGEKTEKSHLL